MSESCIVKFDQSVQNDQQSGASRVPVGILGSRRLRFLDMLCVWTARILLKLHLGGSPRGTLPRLGSPPNGL
jgi:hypothetical protein